VIVRLFLACLCVNATLAVWTEQPVRVFLLPNPPYSYAPSDASGTPQGFLPDLFATLKVPGYSWTLEMLPWARALVETRSDVTGRVILPTLTRTPDRESMFRWIAPIQFPRYFFLGRGPVDSTLRPSDLRDRSVAVLLGNSSDDWLKAHGFSSLIEVATVEQMVKLVRSGRADFLLKDLTGLRFFLRSNGLGPGDLVLGPEVKDLELPLYVVGGLDVEPALERGLAEALARLRRNGTLDRLWDHWQEFEPSKMVPVPRVDEEPVLKRGTAGNFVGRGVGDATP